MFFGTVLVSRFLRRNQNVPITAKVTGNPTPSPIPSPSPRLLPEEAGCDNDWDAGVVFEWALVDIEPVDIVERELLAPVDALKVKLLARDVKISGVL
jgi:hypothetical protein